jgi:ribonuclease-3
MDNIKEFEKIIGIEFDNRDLLIQALTHKSYAIEHGIPEWNERLEFLGDSILSAVMADYLYHKHDEAAEGTLSRIKSQLVSGRILAYMAKRINIGKYVLLSAGEDTTGGRTRESILSDTYESVIGAIYLDQGFIPAKQFIIKNLPKRGILIDADYKSKLQEMIQKKYKTLPVYTIVNVSGPEHEKIFKVEARIKRTLLGKGEGKSKKEAEQQAAKQALEKSKE